MCLRKIVNDLLFTKTYPMISKSIFYISRDKKICEPSILIYEPFGGSKIISNTINKFTGIGRIEFDKDITYIGVYTFSDCPNLEYICIPNSVQKVDRGAFNNNTISGFYGKFASDDHKSLIIDGNLMAVALRDIKSYTIPSDVKNIYGNFTNLKRGDLKVSMDKYCGEDIAFMHSYIQLYSSIVNIPDYAFKYNEFKKIVLTDKTKKIGNKAFMRSEGQYDYEYGTLYKVDKNCNVICMSKKPPVIGKGVFKSIAPGTDEDWEMNRFYYNGVYVPNESVTLYKKEWKDYSDYIQCISDIH